MKILNDFKWTVVIVIILTITIYFNWFSLKTLGGNDFFPFTEEMLGNLNIKPDIWDNNAKNGFGDNVSALIWTGEYVNSVVDLFVNNLGWNWNLVQRIFWLFPYLILSIISPLLLLKKVLPNHKHKTPLTVLGIMIYSFNTYILMLVSGGQINQALAYMFVPIIFYFQFTNILEDQRKWSKKNYYLILAAFLSALQIFFDLRFFYLTYLSILLFVLASLMIKFGERKKILINSFLVILYSFLIPFIVHFFWILPLLFSSGTSYVQEANTTLSDLSFFSFAKFSQTLSLLHPNWPENIFGKLYFTKPEFLIIPVVAFLPLLSIKKSRADKKIHIYIIFFTILALIGAFLAKGVQGPWGFIFSFFYQHIPLFNLFRDPTKFYTLIAVSYTVLFPLGMSFFKNLANAKIFRYGLVFSFIYLIIIISPFWLNTRYGSLAKEDIPKSYLKMEKLFTQDRQFSRILYFPKRNKYAYADTLHPGVDADRFFQTTDLPQLLKIMSKSETVNRIKEAGIKYVVVPHDFNQQIFLTDRRFDNKKNLLVIDTLDSLSYLRKNNNFPSDPAIYTLTKSKPLFEIVDKQNKNILSIKHFSPTKYILSVDSVDAKDRLLFRQAYSPDWQARVDGVVLKNMNRSGFNSFYFNKSGSYQLEIFFTPQKYLYPAFYFSLTFGVIICIYLILSLIYLRKYDYH